MMHKPFHPAPFCPSGQLALFPEEGTLSRVDPAANCWRFYRLTLQPDLFGGTALVRHWGRLGTVGRMRVELYRDRGCAQAALEALHGQKVQRGYQPREARA